MVKNKTKDFRPRTYRLKNGRWTVFDGLCKSCGLCIGVCPFGGLKFSKKEKGVYDGPGVEIKPLMCKMCRNCEQICPDSAIKVEGKKN